MTIENITPEQIKQVDNLLTTLLNNIGAFRLNFNLIIKMMEDIGGLEFEIAEYSKSVQLFEAKGLSMNLSDKLDFLNQHGFLINEYKDYVSANSLQNTTP